MKSLGLCPHWSVFVRDSFGQLYFLAIYVNTIFFFQTWINQLPYQFIFLVTCQVIKSQNFRSRFLSEQSHVFNLDLLSLMLATQQDICCILLACRSSSLYFAMWLGMTKQSNTFVQLYTKGVAMLSFRTHSRNCEPGSSTLTYVSLLSPFRMLAHLFPVPISCSKNNIKQIQDWFTESKSFI